MQDSGTAKVKQNISNSFVRKQTAIYALCLHYSALALKYFRAEQAANKFWTNRTYLAMDTVFSGAYKEYNLVGWFMAHTLQYGIYLEKANNEKHAALNPIVNHFQPYFMYHMREIYAD